MMRTPIPIDSIDCYLCGIQFFVPERWLKYRLEDKKNFWCPNGHQQAFIKSTSERLQEKLDQERSAHGLTLNHLQKTQQALINGKCPVCSRNFKNLQAHLKHKHPSFGQ